MHVLFLSYSNYFSLQAHVSTTSFCFVFPRDHHKDFCFSTSYLRRELCNDLWGLSREAKRKSYRIRVISLDFPGRSEITPELRDHFQVTWKSGTFGSAPIKASFSRSLPDSSRDASIEHARISSLPPFSRCNHAVSKMFM